MKNILVPTDFSKNATNAAHFAAALAHFTGARLLLFHAYHVSAVVAEATARMIDLNLENFENLNQTQIDRLAYNLHQSYGISVTRIMRPGFAADEIPGIAKRLKVDLIVMGMRGIGKLPVTALGSTATELLKTSHNPVLCIPDDFAFERSQDINEYTTSILAAQVLNSTGLAGNNRHFQSLPALSDLEPELPETSSFRTTVATAPITANTPTNVLSAQSEFGLTFPKPEQLVVIRASEPAESGILEFEKIYHSSTNRALVPLLVLPAAR